MQPVMNEVHELSRINVKQKSDSKYLKVLELTADGNFITLGVNHIIKNMSSAHLSSGRLNVGIIQEQARKQLLCLLEKCDGTKVLY